MNIDTAIQDVEEWKIFTITNCLTSSSRTVSALAEETISNAPIIKYPTEATYLRQDAGECGKKALLTYACSKKNSKININISVW